MSGLLSLLWQRRQARLRLEAAQRAQHEPATGPCVRCAPHIASDHTSAGCGITGCTCPRYEP